jgi:hypothetical protein
MQEGPAQVERRRGERTMRSHWWVFTVLIGVLFLSAGALGVHGQEGPGGPGGPPHSDMMGPGGPMGPRMEILGFGEMHPGAVITGAPYSAVAAVESKQTLADGNTINRRTQTTIYRDAQGRTRRETTLPAVGPLAASGQPKSFIMIFDPVAGTAFVLHPDTKIAEQLPSHKGAKQSAGDFQGKFEAHMQKEIADGSLKKEDLGVQTIDGISAQVTRYTHTIPAGQMGNEKPIIVTSERWYSPELQIVVKSTRNDPRFGQTTYTITSLQRQEPAATLFTVPADYTVQTSKVPMHGKGPHGPGALPARPDSMPAGPPPGE